LMACPTIIPTSVQPFPRPFALLSRAASIQASAI
jgi:hypothetical protein